VFAHDLEKSLLTLVQNWNFINLSDLNKNIRILDIAEKAGVSIGTVDRVLHDRGEVSKVTREKILKIIKESDYRPNILASSLAARKSITFASLIPSASGKDAYWSKPKEGIEKAIGQLKQYGVVMNEFYFKMEDPGTFTSGAEKILETSPDGIVLAPWFKRESLEFTRLLDQKKIPYAFIDSTLKEAHPVSFIVQNSYQSGFLAAKLLDYGIKEESTILLIHITKELENAYHLLQREKGFLDYFKSRNETKHKILRIEATDRKDEINEKLGNLGINTDSIDAVFVTNSKVHLAANWFSRLSTSPIIIGYDLIKKNVDLLRLGKIDFLLCQKPESQGYAATNLLFDHIVRKEKVKSQNYTSIDIITRENIDYFSSF
jgi:LacI family transcriptional regulator